MSDHLGRRGAPKLRAIAPQQIYISTAEIQCVLAKMRQKYPSTFKSHWIDGLCSTGDHRWRLNRDEIVLPNTAYAAELWRNLSDAVPNAT